MSLSAWKATSGAPAPLSGTPWVLFGQLNGMRQNMLQQVCGSKGRGDSPVLHTAHRVCRKSGDASEFAVESIPQRRQSWIGVSLTE